MAFHDGLTDWKAESHALVFAAAHPFERFEYAVQPGWLNPGAIIPDREMPVGSLSFRADMDTRLALGAMPQRIPQQNPENFGQPIGIPEYARQIVGANLGSLCAQFIVQPRQRGAQRNAHPDSLEGFSLDLQRNRIIGEPVRQQLDLPRAIGDEAKRFRRARLALWRIAAQQFSRSSDGPYCGLEIVTRAQQKMTEIAVGSPGARSRSVRRHVVTLARRFHQIGVPAVRITGIFKPSIDFTPFPMASMKSASAEGFRM